LKTGDDLAYLKCDFKYVIERRVRMITMEKREKRKEMGDWWEANLSGRQPTSP